MTVEAPDQRFAFGFEVSAFEKAAGPGATRMRIGGIASTEALDADNERLIAEGLDFRPFLEKGWFNDNHANTESTDIVGYPTGAKLVQRGERLPNGSVAKAKGWWVEGYLLDTEKGRALWETIKALESTPRRMGFSVEGSVLPGGRSPGKVGRALIKHIAITHVPKNDETELHALAKALTAGHPSSATFASRAGGTPGDAGPLAAAGGRSAQEDDEEPLVEEEFDEDTLVAKAGDAPDDEVGDGAFLLEGGWLDLMRANHRRAVDQERGQLNKAQAVSWLRGQRPDLTEEQIGVIFEHALREAQ